MIDVSVIDDTLLEDNETVTITLQSIAAGDSDISIGAADNATVTIADTDVAEVTILANTNGAEPTVDGQFTVAISTPSDSDTIVSYTVTGDAVSGVDYTALSGTVTIIAGATSATIDVNVLDDAVLENNEFVTVALDSVIAGDADISIGSASNATITIADDDIAEVTVTANDPNAAEPSDHGQFTINISNQSDSDTVVAYTLTGNAVGGTDFAALSGSVTIAANTSGATVDVTVLDDALLEDNETVTLTIDSVVTGDSDISVGTMDSATLTIVDDDVAEVSVVATDPTATEPADPGQFTVSISNPSDTDTVIAYTISGDATAGSDYVVLSGTVTIAANTTSATIDVNVLDDTLLEDSESVTITLDSVTSGDSDISIGAADSASVTIADPDTAQVSIAATDPAAEATDNGQFTVSITNTSDTDTVLTYTVSGDAAAGSDYVGLSGTVTIAANSTSAIIDVNVIDDLVLEDDELVTVTLTSITSGDSDISISTIDTASLTISDNDSAEVTISAVDSSGSEPSDQGQFAVSLSQTSDTNTTVSYVISGDATSGSDFNALTGTVTIAANTSVALIDIDVIDDSLVEDIESVTLTLTTIDSGNSDISIGTTNAATVTIADDDFCHRLHCCNRPECR